MIKEDVEEQMSALKEEHEEELAALREQLKFLKLQMKESPKKEEDSTLEKELALSKQRNDQFERVIQHLRERTEEAKLEADSLRNELSLAYSKKEERIPGEGDDVKKQLDEALEGRSLAEQKMQEMQRLQEERERALMEESESRLRMAQQYLAKKVKEATLLTEKSEELQKQLEELKKLQDASKSRVSELQGSLDAFKENLRSAEAHAAKWEEKYFNLYDRFQESETRCRGLKKIEEKFMQMQTLLGHLNHLMGTSASTILPSNIPTNSDEGPSFTYDLFGMQQHRTS